MVKIDVTNEKFMAYWGFSKIQLRRCLNLFIWSRKIDLKRSYRLLEII